MVNSEYREAALHRLKRGDIKRSREIYMERFSRKISVSYIEMFIKGEKPVTGEKPGSHQPQDIYQAICEAIFEREAREARRAKMAEKIRKSTLEASRAAALS